MTVSASPTHSSGLMNFCSGLPRTSTISPNCPSPQTASGSLTFSSMSCEYFHQSRGGWEAGTREARHGDNFLFAASKLSQPSLQAVSQVSICSSSALPSFLFFDTPPSLSFYTGCYNLILLSSGAPIIGTEAASDVTLSSNNLMETAAFVRGTVTFFERSETLMAVNAPSHKRDWEPRNMFKPPKPHMC